MYNKFLRNKPNTHGTRKSVACLSRDSQNRIQGTSSYGEKQILGGKVTIFKIIGYEINASFTNKFYLEQILFHMLKLEQQEQELSVKYRNGFWESLP